MKIVITTERYIPDELYWDWAQAVIENVNMLRSKNPLTKPLTKKDFLKLLKDGEFSFEDRTKKTYVKTTYKIERY